MDYQISEKIKGRLETLVADEKMKKALEFIRNDRDVILDKQCELTLIPAPTHHEAEKAKRFMEMLQEEGLTDCQIDEYGNVTGVRKGTGGGKNVLLEAHMDTVFPLDTKLEIIRDGDYIRCPGIVDDTRGMAAVLSTLRALNAAGIETKGDIHFVGTVKEEGTGALRGMKYYVEHHPELDASVSVDGDGWSDITFEATGIQTYEVVFHGIGGHAYGAFGKVANPIHAAGRAIGKISDFVVPSEPRTSFAVTNLEAGSYSAVHSIVPECTIRFNFRSNDQGELEKLREKIFAAIEEACKEETDRWGKDTITYTVNHICDVNAGAQDPHTAIVEGAAAVAEFLGDGFTLSKGGSTNCNRAIDAGLQAVCLGGGRNYGADCHTLNEKFLVDGNEHKGCQAAMLLAVLCAGTDAADSIIE